MNVVWARAPISASEIVEALASQKGWHSRTIRTLLDRLVRKGALKATPEGKRYLYEARVAMADSVRQESQSFLERVFGGEPAAMYDDYYATCAETHATLCIYPGEIDPDEISRRLAIEPTTTVVVKMPSVMGDKYPVTLDRQLVGAGA